MKKLTNQLISFILILSMLCSLSITAFAANRPLSPAEYVGSQEEIDAAKQAFLSLTEQERWLYLETLKTASDAEIEFFETYIKPECPASGGAFPAMAPSMASAAAVALPQEMVTIVDNLMRKIQQLPNIPPSVINCFRAVAVGIAADIADGPLPFGTIIVIGASAALVTVVALNWKTVGPQMGKISKYFQDAFAQSASSISKAFAEMTQNAKKEAEKKEQAEKEKKKAESEKRVKDVLKDKKKDEEHSGNTKIYKGRGGYEQAKKDFDKLNAGKRTQYPNGTTVGELPDGTKINVRPGSSNISGNKPTLEIQGKGQLKIKIRYE